MVDLTFRQPDEFLRDLTHAWRSLRRSPSLVITCVLSLSLGIGVNMTLFSAISAIFHYQPTGTQLERVVWVEPGNSDQWSYLNYRDLRDSAVFSDTFGYRPVRLAFRTQEAVESVNGMAVTNNFFQGLGASMQFGRPFSAADGEPETHPRLGVLSHRFWLNRFAGEIHIVGQTVVLNGQSFVVVGVLPEGYHALTLLSDPDVYVPISDVVLPNLDARSNLNALEVLGRLRPGQSPEQAQSAVTALGRSLEQAFPQQNHDMGRPARLYRVGGIRMESAPLVATVVPIALASLCGLVLLIACANVAGVLLAHETGRQREIAVRIALGATRVRIIRTVLADSFILALLGGVGGLLLTMSLTPWLRDITLPVFGTIHLTMKSDARLFAFGFGLLAMTSVLCGLMPALRATKQDAVEALRSGGGMGPPRDSGRETCWSWDRSRYPFCSWRRRSYFCGHSYDSRRLIPGLIWITALSPLSRFHPVAIQPMR